MAISSKSKIAITALVDLAIHQSKGPVFLASVGARINVSASNLEKLFKALRQKGIVNAKQGPGGGYFICGNLSALKVGDIARVFEEHQVFNVDAIDAYSAFQLFEGLNHYAFEILDEITLQSLVDHEVSLRNTNLTF